MSASDKRPVRRALFSVSDKAGLVDFAKALAKHGVAADLDRRHAKALRRCRASRSPTFPPSPAFPK